MENSSNNSDLSEIYTDLSDLPLYNWVKLSVTGNFKWLVKSGPIPDDISEHYSTLLAEYQTLVKDTRSQQDHQTKVQYAKLANRIDQIKICIEELRRGRNEEIIRVLRDLLGFSRLSYENLERDIKLTETYLQMDVVKFEQAKGKLDKIMKSAESTGSNSEAVFYEQIASLSRWLKFGINPKETSVLEYVTYLNQLQIEIRQQNMNNK